MDQIDRLEDVVFVVCNYFGVGEDELISHRRTARLHRPRRIAVYLADRISGASEREIGAAFDRHPDIIGMYCRSVERELTEDMEKRRVVRDLERMVKRRWLMI